ncbi:hypothetical protein KGM_215372 [Danaus plexippus plexippus]|uniref:Uncharacterized protein n=1 Tax=Danaus plexippus plexippus TaxID=278856 RepID=A0A212FLM8_DANPL|nr:hypothetical protein KGM_215372 [Danaus plexippus plexippus]
MPESLQDTEQAAERRSPVGPSFSHRQQRSVVGRVGDVAELKCRVNRLADRVLSYEYPLELMAEWREAPVNRAWNKLSSKNTLYRHISVAF